MATKKQNGNALTLSKHDKIFAIVENNGKYQIVVGKYLVSHKLFDSVEQAEKYIGYKPWELIINTCNAALLCIKQENGTKTEIEEIKEGDGE